MLKIIQFALLIERVIIELFSKLTRFRFWSYSGIMEIEAEDFDKMQIGFFTNKGY